MRAATRHFVAGYRAIEEQAPAEPVNDNRSAIYRQILNELRLGDTETATSEVIVSVAQSETSSKYMVYNEGTGDTHCEKSFWTATGRIDFNKCRMCGDESESLHTADADTVA